MRYEIENVKVSVLVDGVWLPLQTDARGFAIFGESSDCDEIDREFYVDGAGDA